MTTSNAFPTSSAPQRSVSIRGGIYKMLANGQKVIVRSFRPDGTLVLAAPVALNAALREDVIHVGVPVDDIVLTP